jgi:uncharacterized protein
VDSDFPNFEIDYSLPIRLGYDVDLLDRFCRKDPDCVLTFYGGEPLLCVDEIKKIMDNVKAALFMIQTNGLLLNRLEAEYVNRFHTILVSIDGDEVLTDFYRGKGVFSNVVNNLKLIKHHGFEGEVIARMTVMEQTDIYRQVLWLLNNQMFPFTSVHWQLNAGFWKDNLRRRDFEKWSSENYNLGISKLAKFWVDIMEKRGSVLKLYPFLGIAQSLLNKEENCLLRCGSGWINYAIQTDGQVIPCPSMWGMRDYYLGHISDLDPTGLKKVFVGEPCQKCRNFPLCRGRCLYANITQRWNPEAYRHVCKTVENLIEAVTEQLPRIQELIGTGRIRLTDFEFQKYNGCEIIP